MASLLLVEDDARFGSALLRALAARGHTVAWAATGRSGLQRALEDGLDLVVLDLGLPDIDGAPMLRMLRAVSRVPVIVVTARDDDESVVDLLEHGADDYVIKPFTAAHLSARITAVLRRAGAATPDQRLVVGDLVVDLRAHTVELGGHLLDLRPREFELLAFLASRPGVVVSRREIMAQVWHLPCGGADKTVDAHLSWLRRKLGESADEPRLIRTVRNVGVKLVEPTAA
ncbi:response regulator transcription factor [Knoellia sp. 3-2P3]|uniref:response regulator transcription factor n=1 Tax=unclassified Knoellia TaxID=2618719 RepID=UPI0023DC2E2A|nr:response regulator transcription factor [Knoellia sp. 3-2P3]MDF2093365.1 response regulator transcription factor [Knoellia sp. 3-2P3]